MSNKKLIQELMAKLNVCTDPIEQEELEDQILLLVEQDDLMNDLAKSEYISEPKFKTKPKKEDIPVEKLDEREKIRLQRESQRKAKNEQYQADTKLDSVDEELLRTQLMNEALATNDDYATQKLRKHSGLKNKYKKF
jgi:hypothetical protein